MESIPWAMQKEKLTIYLVIASNWANKSFIFCIFKFDLGGFWRDTSLLDGKTFSGLVQ
jgi:hypothetical protein